MQEYRTFVEYYDVLRGYVKPVVQKTVKKKTKKSTTKKKESGKK